MSGEATLSRVPELLPEAMTADQRQVHDAILAGPRGVVRGPVKVWLHNPGLARPAQELGAYCRFGTVLPARLSELAVILTAAHWRAGYEWQAHAPLARKEGIPVQALEAIRTGAEPSFEQADEQIVYHFTTALLTEQAVPAALWTEAQATLGMQGVIDLVGVLGYYALISMTIKAFEISASDPAVEGSFSRA